MRSGVSLRYLEVKREGKRAAGDRKALGMRRYFNIGIKYGL